MDRIVRFGKDVVNGWLNAEAFTLAASLAYYAIFAIAPFILITIHIASFFLDRTEVTESLTKEMSDVIGPSGSGAIEDMLNAAGDAQPEGWAALIGLAVLLFATAGFVGSLQDALDKIWDAPPRPGGPWSFIRSKLLSFSLVLAAAFMLLVSLVLSALVTALTGGVTTTLGLPDWLVATIVGTANFLISVLIFIAIFKFVPSVQVTWRAAAGGGTFHRSPVRRRTLRTCLVSGTRGAGFRLRGGDCARTPSGLDLLLGTDPFSWCTIFPKHPGLGEWGNQ
jgi:membrane protein